MIYDHRSGDPCIDFSYDTLDRLTLAEYGIQDNNEVFTIDDLGNRDNVNIRDGNDVNYVVDDLTNRYDTVDGNSLAYDAAGNLITDKDDYDYTYDYENRIIKITKDGNDIAEFAYDALGRRIRKIDSIAGTTRLYFYNDKWQVLTETDAGESIKAWYAYGNYIDEVLLTAPIKIPMLTRCYVHDHLYSPAALTTASGTVQERYEYDAYGSPYVLEPNFADDPDGKTDWANSYYFTGRRVDFLNDANLVLQHNRHRYYDYYSGRWLTHDPKRYVDGLNLYEYGASMPLMTLDAFGLEWVIHRNAGYRATAEVVDSSETIQSLAAKVKLEPNQFRRWVQLHGSTIVTCPDGSKTLSELTLTDSICPGQRLTVPNSFPIVVGEMNGLARAMLLHYASAVRSALIDKGFNAYVLDFNAYPISARQISQMNEDDVWGFALFGHGHWHGFVLDYHWAWPSPGTGWMPMVVDDLMVPGHFSTNFKKGGAIVYSCFSSWVSWDEAVSNSGTAHTTGYGPLLATTGIHAYDPYAYLDPVTGYTWEMLINDLVGE